MSELTQKFLTELKRVTLSVAADAGETGEWLRGLTHRLTVSDAPNDVPVTLENGHVVIHTGHPAVAHLLSKPQHQRTDLLYFVSSMMSILNREEEDITDEHERMFHHRLVNFAIEECQGSWV